MTEVNTHQRPGEFIALAAFLMATIALAIDMMLPAMGPMAVDLELTEPHRISWIILSIFAGRMPMESHLCALSQAECLVFHTTADRCDLDVPMETSIISSVFFLIVSSQHLECLNFCQ